MADIVKAAVRRLRRWMGTLPESATEAELDTFVTTLLEEARARPLTSRQRTSLQRALAEVRREWSKRMYRDTRERDRDL
jgi:hypothetical protein